MRTICWIFILMSATIISGCSTYPQNMTKQEWDALTSEQQSIALEKQKQTDTYNADNLQCSKKAEKIVRVKISGFGGFWSNGGPTTGSGEIDVHLGEDLNIYSKCMEQAGWKSMYENSLLGGSMSGMPLTAPPSVEGELIRP